MDFALFEGTKIKTSARHAPGFISSALHRSLDGTKVTMYAQWRTIEDYEAMRKNPATAPYLWEALTIAKFEPGMYEVVETYEASAPCQLTCDTAPMSEIEIATANGTCPCHVYRPTGSGPWPAVLIFMDGVGIRPAMLEVGERLATYGYFVLLPDLFYRAGRYEPMDARAIFSDPEKVKVLREKFFGHVSPAKVMSDTRAFLDYLAAQPEVKPGPIGTTGYCMGGLMSLTAAGTYPDRIAASASYHGGRLATDAPDSPHLLAPKIRSRIYIAGAIEDGSFPDDMKARLEDALTQAGVDHRIETYPAKHGWVLRDTPVFNAVACERHWQTLIALLDAKLKG